MVRLSAKSQSNAADEIKRVARRMFARQGVDGVTVRDIAHGAGQKNHGAVGYHFGSKEALVREIVEDGAAIIDDRRNLQLDALEAKGGPRSTREIVELMVRSAIDLDESGTGEDSYIRFITMLGMTHRELFMDVLDGRWNVGYQRCLKHLRRLMPEMSNEMKNQRFVFMGTYLSSVISLREAALAEHSKTEQYWKSDATLDHFITTLTALIEAPA